MTYSNISEPEPTIYLIPEAYVTYKGNDYCFWAEHDLRDDTVNFEFMGGEPVGDFDFDQFEKDCRSMLEDYDAFVEEHDISAEKCDACKKVMSEGYHTNDGIYCSLTCAGFTQAEWDKFYTDEGDNYWTEWK